MFCVAWWFSCLDPRPVVAPHMLPCGCVKDAVSIRSSASGDEAFLRNRICLVPSCKLHTFGVELPQ